MVYDKNFFLDQLRNGQDVNAMGQAMADAMNAAIADYNAEQEAARKAEAARVAKVELATKKKALGLKIVDLFREYAALTGNTAMDEMEFDDSDLDMLIQGLDQTFALMGAVKDLKDAIDNLPDEQVPVVHQKLQKAKTKSDDEILADFIASLAR